MRYHLHAPRISFAQGAAVARTTVVGSVRLAHAAVAMASLIRSRGNACDRRRSNGKVDRVRHDLRDGQVTHVERAARRGEDSHTSGGWHGGASYGQNARLIPWQIRLASEEMMSLVSSLDGGGAIRDIIDTTARAAYNPPGPVRLPGMFSLPQGTIVSGEQWLLADHP